jgi:hypothetical protein
MHLSKTKLENMTESRRWDYLKQGCDPGKLSRFWKFHMNNTHVFEFLEKSAIEQKLLGWRKSSVWLILNMKRWGPGSTIDTESQYKISNDYFAYYARLLLSKHPQFVNWIELKPLKGQTFNYSDDSFGG